MLEISYLSMSCLGIGLLCYHLTCLSIPLSPAQVSLFAGGGIILLLSLFPSQCFLFTCISFCCSRGYCIRSGFSVLLFTFSFFPSFQRSGFEPVLDSRHTLSPYTPHYFLYRQSFIAPNNNDTTSQLPHTQII